MVAYLFTKNMPIHKDRLQIMSCLNFMIPAQGSHFTVRHIYKYKTSTDETFDVMKKLANENHY